LNYYEHHIGDFAEATAHLSFVEDAAYSRLIRKYYAQEKPLPADTKAVQRLVGARSKDEREAVDSVLHEFFDLQAEIARYQDKQAKAKRSAQARWNAKPPHSEGNANAYANASPDAMRTHSEGNALQSPGTRHQSLSESDGAAATSAGQVGQAFKRAGVNPMSLNLSDPVLMSLIAQGATPDEFEGIAREAVAKGIAKPQPWVCIVLQQRRNQAQQVKLAQPTQEAKPWDNAA
jgi:uncharacterized protein YdaU (DUF1376 family)